MAAQKFELFMGCMGNGTTVCNKAVYEYGDYKTIAHISNHGVIKFYVPEDYIPADAMEKIKRTAERSKAEFMEKWNQKTTRQKCEYMLDIPSIGYGGVMNPFYVIWDNNRELPFEERVKLMEEKFFQTHM